MKNAYPYAQITIEGKSTLEEVAAIVSETLFAGIPFGDKELGLFEEVPGLRLKGKFSGLFVGLRCLFTACDKSMEDHGAWRLKLTCWK